MGDVLFNMAYIHCFVDVRFGVRRAVFWMAPHLLSSLNVTYIKENSDAYGLRAAVPRVVILTPQFHPRMMDYKASVSGSMIGCGICSTGNEVADHRWRIV